MTTPMPPAPAADPLHLPHLWEFAPGVTYLNHGAFGAVPTAVRAERQRWQERVDANPMGFYRRRKNAELDRARLEVARFLGADDEGVAFVQNATTGVASVLAALPLAAGDRILVTDHIYGAVLWNAQRAAELAGGEVDVVPVPLEADDAQAVAAVVAAVTDRTRVAILDHISSVTAKLFPIAALVAALRERGVQVIVDAAHAPGAVPVDLRAIDPDYWSGNLHKWAAAPRGTAGLYARPGLREQLRSFPVSWREPEGFPYTFSFVGTMDQTAWLSAPAGLAFFGELGWEAVRARNNALARTGQQLIAESIGASLEGMPGERDPEAYALPMRLIPLDAVGDDRDACLALMDRLAEEFAIEVPIDTWNGRALLRVSAQLYNSEADYERLAGVLKTLL
jgi:isopenicillin-N epimerase